MLTTSDDKEWFKITTIIKKNNMFSTFWAAAPKGPMTYAFTQGKFLLLLLLLLLLRPPPSKLIS